MGKATGEAPKALIDALRRLLRPLVRLLITHGITLPFLTNLLKNLYVEVAETDFSLENKPASDSRISLLTGVHRKDVRRLRHERDDLYGVPEAVSLGAQVIATWVSDKKYLDKTGEPRRLPIRGDTRTKRSFEALVATVSRQDLRPRVVLDELLRLDIVKLHDGETVELLVDAFVPASGFDEKAHYFGQNIRDHIAAAAHNLDDPELTFLERAVTYHRLSEKDVEELRQLAEQGAMDSLKQVNQRARQLKRRNDNKPGPWRRINFGSYFYSEPYAHDTDEDNE